jgi:ATP-binding cassette subfamily B protein
MGSSLLGLSDAAESIGFKSLSVKISLEKLLEAPLPCILHWNKNHYVVLYDIKTSTRLSHQDKYYISDPAHGRLTYTKEEFIKHWIGNNANEHTEEGVVLLLEPTSKFYNSDFEKGETP